MIQTVSSTYDMSLGVKEESLSMEEAAFHGFQLKFLSRFKVSRHKCCFCHLKNVSTSDIVLIFKGTLSSSFCILLMHSLFVCLFCLFVLCGVLLWFVQA